MNVSDYFAEKFGYPPRVTQFTPGRVNLIGEHIDYNGGTVLPMAIDKGVHVALSPREDDKINIASDRFLEVVSSSLNQGLHNSWAKYAFYASKRAVRLGWINGGVDLALSSNLVDGAGLSSSAAVVVGVMKAFRSLSGADIDDVGVAVLAKNIENEDMGVPCGIMDQMVVSVAKSMQAISLNTQSLSYEALDLAEGYVFPVIHSGARRSLDDGRYKARSDECIAAKHALGTNNLCKLDLSDLDRLGVDTLKRRVRHCITEHARVLAASKAMRACDIQSFAQHMNDSHTSMRDDFEMSIPAVDDLVETSREHGAIGARLTGGGFGGCIVSCVSAGQVEAWTEAVQSDAPNSFRVV